MSCLADHSICSSETIYVVRECPLQTVSDRLRPCYRALLCRLHRDRIAVFENAVDGLDKQIAGKAGRWQRETGLLTSVPGFGDRSSSLCFNLRVSLVAP